ncbi:MAG: MopE-related protein [Proteobacteria bacterium]|nr:MopE-related protein [Pseudomonadota bacterium]
MRLLAGACAGFAALLLTTTVHAGDPLKPYVVLILDTSGSMGPAPFGAGPTGSGPPSCGGSDTRIDHAKCAINKIANSYGDMVFALARFREYTSGTYATSCDADGDHAGNESCGGAGCTLPVSGGDQCNTQGAYCGDCDEATGLNDVCSAGNPCSGNDTCVSGRCAPPAGADPSMAGKVPGTCTTADREFQLLSPLVDGNNQNAVNVTDFSCGTCSMNAAGTATTAANEIWGVSANTFTPLAAVLNGAKRYWTGQQASDGTVIWPSATAGFAPIAADPTKTAFLPGGCDASPTCTSNCCTTQCRPYITILLTDGAETCTSFTNTTAAAAAMLTTDVGGSRYKVLTKPIGFGIAPGNAQIESLAHAGGAVDVPGVNEGYYANDEASLQLAISTILDDAIKTELCNNVDDDCDSLVDEGFNKGAVCDNGQQGVCRRTGAVACKPDGTAACNAVAVVPGSEGTVCNSLDDDCDGKIDEGITGCTCIPQGETCNNMDDNCNGLIDDGPITRPCGTGVCQGIETCSAGVFSGCTAPPSSTEVCDGLDNDCDGIKDGITQACSTMPANGFPVGDPRNNPGAHPAVAPSCLSEGPAVCICHPGNKTCPANGPGVFGACTGEVLPATELCNNLDDDCDGKVDETTGGQDCSTNCGIGTTACINGVITCNAVTAPNDDTCDGVDDDCDGMIDEDYVSPGACGNGVVCNGMERCVNGTPTCIGDPIGNESCNCTDDDCDTKIDEGSTCPTGSTCTNCQCAFPCAGGEFPCPLGKRCDANNFCIEDPCFGIDCPPIGGVQRECVVTGNAGACADACANENCSGGLKCQPSSGQCVPDTCAAFPEKCTGAENCVNGACVSNPCAGVTCPNAGEYCVAGVCHGSCAGVDCASDQRCELGACVADPCGKQCPAGQVCHDSTGECLPNPCVGVPCPGGQWCDPHGDGGCTDDPCIGTTCPDPAQVCIGGTCDDPVTVTVDGGEQHVTTGGGGGCSTTGDGGGLVLVGLGLGIALTRRRRGLGGAL